jgi:TPR repeat protein
VVAGDYNEAFKELKLAAELGDVEAQYNAQNIPEIF